MKKMVTVQSGYYNHYFVRKLYSVYILARHSLISNDDDNNSQLLNTDATKTSNISLYSNVDRDLAFFLGYCTGGDIPAINIFTNNRNNGKKVIFILNDNGTENKVKNYTKMKWQVESVEEVADKSVSIYKSKKLGDGVVLQTSLLLPSYLRILYHSKEAFINGDVKFPLNFQDVYSTLEPHGLYFQCYYNTNKRSSVDNAKNNIISTRT